MRVQRDFEDLYAHQADPWRIGAADSDRYDLYRSLLLEHAASRGSILDIGSGFGAFLARFREDFDEAVAVELIRTAIDVGRARHPWIRFCQGSAADLDRAGVGQRRYDAIVFSDVIYYLDDDGKSRSLDWIRDHLRDDGVALIAAYCPGGDYLTADELAEQVRFRFAVQAERRLESGHAAFVARRRRRRVAITLEEASPRCLDALASAGVSATLFPDLDRYLSLLEREPASAQAMADAWRHASRRGHDVQLRLGADALDGDLLNGLDRRISALRDAIEPANHAYRVRCVRIAAEPPEPFWPLYDALAAAGIDCDSTCGAGGPRPWSGHQPYFPSRYDARLKAPPAETAIVELPVALPSGRRRLDPPVTPGQLRRARRIQAAGRSAYWMVRRARRWVNRLLPRRVAHALAAYPPEQLVQDEYIVLSAQADGTASEEAVRRCAARLDGSAEFATLSEMAEQARSELVRTVSADRREEALRQVRREYDAVMGTERNEAQSARLQAMIPPAARRILDLGCGAGDWTARIAERRPEAYLIGVDVGEDFIAAARTRHGAPRVSFGVEDFAALSFADASFDCVYADNSLEHAFDVDRALAEVRRVLCDGGVLVAALPSDARNPGRTCDNHTWKTAPHDVRMRLEAAGFTDLSVEEVDVLRRLGMPPYPPSDDRMMYVKAARRG
jgi:SAM-dependent methyltransferase